MTDLDFAISDREEAGHLVVSIVGMLDIDTASKLREHLVASLNAGQALIIIDLDSVNLLDATGLNVLVGGSKRCASQGGRLQVVTTKPKLVTIFSATGTDKIIGLKASVAEALTGAS